MVLNYTDDKETFHRVACYSQMVEVFGDGDMGSYEYRVLESSGVVLHQSNCGYGSPAVALRDGLSWALGDD